MRNDRSAQMKTLKTTEEAARWFYELRSEDFKDHEAYLAWLVQSPQHVEAFLRVSETDASLGRIDAERSIEIMRTAGEADASNVVVLTAENKPGASRRRIWTLAAGIALVSVLVAAVLTIRLGDSMQYVTAIGEQRAIALEDGSLLHMNTGTRVQVRYSANERTIRLLDGEALFRVHHDSARPFRVQSGGAIIQAIGTQFNVLRRADGSTVSVIEGRVRVDREPQTATSPSQPATLGAGEEIRLTNDGSVAAQGKADIARVNAWRQRRLVFMNETLGAIAAEFNRYNRALVINVEGSAAELRDYQAMSFNADDPESLLAVLERDPELELEREPGQVTIRRR